MISIAITLRHCSKMYVFHSRNLLNSINIIPIEYRELIPKSVYISK